MFCSLVLEISFRKFIFGILFSIFYFNVGKCDDKANIVKIIRGNANKSSHMEGKIVRGSPVDIERYPWSVLVFNSGALCAGTILNMFSILSAAHCFSHNKKTTDISVHVGSRYLYDHNAIIHSVNHIDSHNDYNKEFLFSCDIALLFVDNPINFNKKAQKADLVDHDRWMNKNEHGFTVTGWGMVKHNGPLSEHGLLMATLKYVPSTECSAMHNLKLSEDMFCLCGEAQEDTCNGDSGGGVLWNGYLVGIVSHGEGCANKGKPSIYSNVWYFRKWITDSIKEQSRYYNGRNTNIDRLQAKILDSIQCRAIYETDTTSPPQNKRNKLIKLSPYLHQFDKNELKIRNKIVKLKQTVHEKRQGKSDEYVFEKLMDYEEINEYPDDADDIDNLVAKNKYIKLKITA